MSFKLLHLEEQKFVDPLAQRSEKEVLPKAPLLRGRDKYVEGATPAAETEALSCLSPFWSRAHPGSPAGPGTNRALCTLTRCAQPPHSEPALLC